jgi:6-phosphogluconolactonase
MAQLRVADDEDKLAARAADRVTQLIEEAVMARGAALVALSGGTTPRRLYANLADPNQPWRARIPWRDVHLFWSDERHVPPDHPDSNYGMAKAALIDHVPIPAGHVHRIHGERASASDAAADYDKELGEFDLMLLGLGEDAHLASIFPGSELLDSDSGLRAAAVWAPHLGAWRITLTPQSILDSRAIVVLVAGANKADAIQTVLEAALDLKAHPAQMLRTAGDRVEWFLDRAAAARL